MTCYLRGACIGAMALVVVFVAAELLTPVFCERWLRKGGI